MIHTENHLQRVPHLTTAHSGPLQELEKYILQHQTKIECWLRQQFRKTPAPIYASVDLRNSGFKLAPVDTNLFPAGFNNLNNDFLPLAIQAAQAAIENLMPGCSRIMIIPESHTRNPFYFESLGALQNILSKAGFEVHIGSLLNLEEPKEIILNSGRKLLLEPIKRVGNRIKINEFSPCFILLNNDLSEGVPDILQDIEQSVYPSTKLGWDSRLKSNHFKYYAEISQEFSKLINIDPWLIDPYFSKCSAVDFLKREGEECLVHHTDELLEAIAKKYQEYNINQKPFVIIKADAGTYGMGVLPVHSSEEIRGLNRKKRNNMSTSKGNRLIDKVILQEGVYTFETWQNAVAEPVVYMIGQHVIGGFYRVHTGRGVTDNLNSPGMHFVPLAFAEACNNPDQFCSTPDACSNRFYSYGVIARLALLAAAREQDTL
jgi:glutamate--cysteine ligase